MSKTELKNIIMECCNDVLFSYNGKNSGVTSEVHDYVPTFQMWHGADTKEYSNIDDLMADKFFSGKSLIDLSKTIKFTFA